ncbi:Calcium/calmodulin-dependent protein kinase type 1 [Porphyridium purpureum]|uniref:Calcium/calmodulin-dependent protein kinase type 1 n=1 Tax=Porphyridium purpureum TaxID=35688 RepID=A0A5J4YK08_PORPP|nr:Calcium/calmodulin-dependent protein kinase type 1 [Porphyridium purpureum]|eukprot:POR0927..scf251_18
MAVDGGAAAEPPASSAAAHSIDAKDCDAALVELLEVCAKLLELQKNVRRTVQSSAQQSSSSGSGVNALRGLFKPAKLSAAAASERSDLGNSANPPTEADRTSAEAKDSTDRAADEFAKDGISRAENGPVPKAADDTLALNATPEQGGANLASGNSPARLSGASKVDRAVIDVLARDRTALLHIEKLQSCSYSPLELISHRTRLENDAIKEWEAKTAMFRSGLFPNTFDIDGMSEDEFVTVGATLVTEDYDTTAPRWYVPPRRSSEGQGQHSARQSFSKERDIGQAFEDESAAKDGGPLRLILSFPDSEATQTLYGGGDHADLNEEMTKANSGPAQSAVWASNGKEDVEENVAPRMLHTLPLDQLVEESMKGIDIERFDRDFRTIYGQSPDFDEAKDGVRVAAGEFYRTYEEMVATWEIEARIFATGGFCEVVRGLERKEGANRRVCAVKILNKQGSIFSMKNAVREIFSLRYTMISGGHENVVQLYEVSENSKNVYIVNEFLGGGELLDQIDSSGSYTEGRAASLVRQMLKALHFCHSLNLSHRDVKPENFIFTGKAENSKLKLIDFGISHCDTENNELLRTQVGTPLYISPEVLYGEPYVGSEVDMWSMGIIVYIMLSGRPPFDDSDLRELIRHLKYDPVTFDGLSWVTVSECAKHFIRGLLSKDPTKRMTSQEALTHPWLTKASMFTSNELLLNVQDNIRAFHHRRRWRAAIAAVQARNRMQSLYQVVLEEQQARESAPLADGTDSEIPLPSKRESSVTNARNNSGSITSAVLSQSKASDFAHGYNDSGRTLQSTLSREGAGLPSRRETVRSQPASAVSDDGGVSVHVNSSNVQERIRQSHARHARQEMIRSQRIGTFGIAQAGQAQSRVTSALPPAIPNGGARVGAANSDATGQLAEARSVITAKRGGPPPTIRPPANPPPQPSNGGGRAPPQKHSAQDKVGKRPLSSVVKPSGAAVGSPPVDHAAAGISSSASTGPKATPTGSAGSPGAQNTLGRYLRKQSKAVISPETDAVVTEKSNWSSAELRTGVKDNTDGGSGPFKIKEHIRNTGSKITDLSATPDERAAKSREPKGARPLQAMPNVASEQSLSSPGRDKEAAFPRTTSAQDSVSFAADGDADADRRANRRGSIEILFGAVRPGDGTKPKTLERLRPSASRSDVKSASGGVESSGKLMSLFSRKGNNAEGDRGKDRNDQIAKRGSSGGMGGGIRLTLSRPNVVRDTNAPSTQSNSAAREEVTDDDFDAFRIDSGPIDASVPGRGSGTVASTGPETDKHDVREGDSLLFKMWPGGARKKGSKRTSSAGADRT